MNTDISIQHSITDDIIIFEFTGELDETNTDKVFSDIHKDIAISQKKKVIFDFTNLKYLNSKAIWYVADSFWVLQEKSGKFVICWMNDSVTMVADIVWLQTIVKIYTTLDEAISSMSL